MQRLGRKWNRRSFIERRDRKPAHGRRHLSYHRAESGDELLAIRCQAPDLGRAHASCPVDRRWCRANLPAPLGTAFTSSKTVRSSHLVLPVLALALAASPSGQADDQATVAIDAATVENHISPRLYGQFAEFMYQNIKFGLHAELLRDRGFEEPANAIGLPRYWERDPDDRDDDPAIHFRWDDSAPYPPACTLGQSEIEHSLRIDLSVQDGQRRGIHEGAVPVRAGIAYRGSVWLRTWDFAGHLTAALEQDRTGGEAYASADVGGITSDGSWRQYRFTLRPTKTDPLAKLAILLDGRGRVWIDQVSLMPGDAVDEVRADVFERVKALRPSFVRWPGGNVAQDYHWLWGVGPRDERPEWINLAWSNEREPSDFGTDEFIRFCRNLGAEPHLVVNIEGRGATPEEAAAWVEYVNGATTTKYGALRAKHGHAEPFGVKTWELGNEIWGDWVRGHSDAETYARNYLRYRGSDARRRPVVALHRGRRQRHGLEPHAPEPCGRADRLSGDPPLLRVARRGTRGRAT